MTTATLNKHAIKLEKMIKTASRTLLEFEVAQSKWEIAHGFGKPYKSADAFMRHIRRKLK